MCVKPRWPRSGATVMPLPTTADYRLIFHCDYLLYIIYIIQQIEVKEKKEDDERIHR